MVFFSKSPPTKLLYFLLLKVFSSFSFSLALPISPKGPIENWSPLNHGGEKKAKVWAWRRSQILVA